VQLLTGILSPIYAALKPFDPITKKAGVFTLYLHTALAHVRSTIGKSFPTLKRICDDNIEGTIAALNRYFNSRTNNVCRTQSLINKEAMALMGFHEPDGRQPAEQLLFTEELVLCPCVARLGSLASDGLKAVVRFAFREAAVSASADPSSADVLEGPAADKFARARAATVAASSADGAALAAAAVVTADGAAPNNGVRTSDGAEQGGGTGDPRLTPAELAAQSADAAKQAAVDEQTAVEALVGVARVSLMLHVSVDTIRVGKSDEADSMEVELQRRLKQVQRRLFVCLCGCMTGRTESEVACEAVDGAAAAAAAAADAVEDTAADGAAAAATAAAEVDDTAADAAHAPGVGDGGSVVATDDAALAAEEAVAEMAVHEGDNGEDIGSAVIPDESAPVAGDRSLPCRTRTWRPSTRMKRTRAKATTAFRPSGVSGRARLALAAPHFYCRWRLKTRTSRPCCRRMTQSNS